MKIFIIWCVSTQNQYLGKICFLTYGQKCSFCVTIEEFVLIEKVLDVHGQKCVWPLWPRHSKTAISQELINGINWFFACWYKFREDKSYFSDFWAGAVKSVRILLVNRTLSLRYPKNEFINWAGFLHADNDAITLVSLIILLCIFDIQMMGFRSIPRKCSIKKCS